MTKVRAPPSAPPAGPSVLSGDPAGGHPRYRDAGRRFRPASPADSRSGKYPRHTSGRFPAAGHTYPVRSRHLRPQSRSSCPGPPKRPAAGQPSHRRSAGEIPAPGDPARRIPPPQKGCRQRSRHLPAEPPDSGGSDRECSPRTGAAREPD